MSTGKDVITFVSVIFLGKKYPPPVAAWSSGTGAGIVISMVFYGSHIILLSAAALQHYGH